MPLGYFSPGPMEVVVILLIVLLLFGAKRLPDLARALGRSLSEFKKGREDGTQTDSPSVPDAHAGHAKVRDGDSPGDEDDAHA